MHLLQILLLVPFLMGIFDLIYTIYQDIRGDVAKFQYFTPFAIVISMVRTHLQLYDTICAITKSCSKSPCTRL